MSAESQQTWMPPSVPRMAWDDAKADEPSELAAMPGSVNVRRMEYAWRIERPNSIDIVRHTLRTASEPSLNYYEQIIGDLCAAFSQNDQHQATASK